MPSQAHEKAINAAVNSSVKRIFYSCLAFAGNYANDSVANVMGAHLRTEAFLASNLPATTRYTSIREGMYSESFPI